MGVADRDRARACDHGVLDHVAWGKARSISCALALFVAACGGSAAVAPPASVPNAAPAVPPREPRCADAIVLALVGSGQRVKSATDLSVSLQLGAIYQAAAATIGPAHVLAVHVVDYPDNYNQARSAFNAGVNLYGTTSTSFP